MTYRYKKVFLYECADCGKKRSTTKEEKVAAGGKGLICKPCAALKVPEDQLSLFGDKPGESVQNSP